MIGSPGMYHLVKILNSIVIEADAKEQTLGISGLVFTTTVAAVYLVGAWLISRSSRVDSAVLILVSFAATSKIMVKLLRVGLATLRTGKMAGMASRRGMFPLLIVGIYGDANVFGGIVNKAFSTINPNGLSI